MDEEEKYFDYSMMPGKKLNSNKYINDGRPIISIITGYYNCKKYIRETANSIINQTFPYWEWIIINDGSTEDGTKETLEEIANLDSRIKIFNEKNRGRILTRDYAISKAQCDLIFIIDADDAIDKTMLECCYWTLKTNPKASWVYADLVNFDGQEFLWKQIFDCDVEKKENIISVCSLIRKEALLDVGGYGAVDDDVHEDWHLWLRMLEKGYFPIRMNYYGFWYRKKKEGGVLDSINKDKKRDEHAREEIRKQAKKIKEKVYAIQFPTTTKSNYDSYPYIFNWDRKPINNKGEKIRLLFIFYVIPWLKSEYPNVVFLDYLHSENRSWRNGEYPRDSVAIDGFLDKTYTCTQVLRQSMKDNMGRSIDNVKTVYIGVDEEEFDSNKINITDNNDLANNLNKIKGKQVILFLCRISEEKRPIFMVKVFKKLLEKNKNLILLVVGDGPQLKEMKESAKKDGLEENIIFFGMQSNVKPFYKVADVSVICSLVEGLTITTYESLAMGTPVVTADVGGQKELVDATCGRVVQNIQTADTGCFDRNYKDEEINRYVIAIEEVLSDNNLKNNCRNKILNGYTVNNMVKIFEDDFENFAKKGSKINPQSVVNKDLYKQYIVMYNQLDIRNYFPQSGGMDSENIELHNYKMTKLKEKLWKNPLWRGMIKFLQITGIMKVIKKIIKNK